MRVPSNNNESADETLYLPVAKYTSLCSAVLRAMGVSEEQSDAVVGNLLRADQRGIHTHGIAKLSVYVHAIERGVIAVDAKPTLSVDKGAIAIIDGNRCLGQVAATAAAEIACKKAQEFGVSCVGIRNCGHVGHLGDYSRMIMRNRLIAIAFANTNALVAPHGGKKPMLGTNPVSYAIPAKNGDGIVGDFATSASSAGQIALLLSEDRRIPPEWALDKDGSETTEPETLFRDPSFPLVWDESNFVGALLPFAGHKGYALGLLVDIMAGALPFGRTNGEVQEGENGCSFVAINPAFFGEYGIFESGVDSAIRRLRSCPPRTEGTAVMVPGDPERTAEQRTRKGYVEIPKTVWDQTMALGRAYNVLLDDE